MWPQSSCWLQVWFVTSYKHHQCWTVPSSSCWQVQCSSSFSTHLCFFHLLKKKEPFKPKLRFVEINSTDSQNIFLIKDLTADLHESNFNQRRSQKPDHLSTTNQWSNGEWICEGRDRFLSYHVFWQRCLNRSYIKISMTGFWSVGFSTATILTVLNSASKSQLNKCWLLTPAVTQSSHKVAKVLDISPIE